MTKFYLVLLLAFSFEFVYGQKELSFPTGITVDPAIENVCKSRKDINSFKIVQFSNDSIVSQRMLNSINKLPLTTITSINQNDTLFTFIGMLLPWGFQISLKTTGPEVSTFVSSKSCKCFKDSLSKVDLSYGAAARSTSLTLVLSKLSNIKKGDKIYGYINAKGGDIYHLSGSQEVFEKWNFQYEGFFVVEF